MDIILFGMQGSGKGTQGSILAERYGLKVFEMGAELRNMIASGSELGQKIKGIVEGGDLVDDQTILQVIKSFLEGLEPSQAVLFDGIPRTIEQSYGLLNLLKEYDRETFGVLIKISEDEAIKRLTQRRLCEKCKIVYPANYEGETCKCGGKLITRQDDNVESIQNRLKNFREATQPVIDDFYKIDRLIEVDGEQTIENVSHEMIEKTAYLFS